MAQKKHTRIIFDLPEDTTLVDTLDQILKDNGLEESDEEFFLKDIKGKEPHLLILRDAAMVMVETKIPHKKLAEFLSKHLKTTHHKAEKIIKELEEKLIPFAKTIDPEKEAELRRREKEVERQQEASQSEQRVSGEQMEEIKKEAFRKAKEELMAKIKANLSIEEPEPEQIPEINVKKIDIFDVEKNAKTIEHEHTEEEDETPAPQARPPVPQPTALEEPPVQTDKYKETIE